ncbi:MAG: DUF1559 domain-containing protein, partial [Pirellulales bacterium]|nr:DUF1559 domain-containing protein [Pirellulales bacterium]
TLMLGELAWDVGNIGRAVWARGNSDGTAGCYTAKNVYHPINFAKYQLITGGIAKFNEVSFGSNHSGGCHFAMGDGSVHFINQTIDMTLYRSLASRASGETVMLP